MGKYYYLYLLDSSSTSTNHILVELLENWNFHTEIGSNLFIVKRENKDIENGIKYKLWENSYIWAADEI